MNSATIIKRKMDARMVVDLRWSGLCYGELIATVVSNAGEETLRLLRLISPHLRPVWVVTPGLTKPYNGVLGPELEKKYQALPKLDVSSMRRDPKLLSKEIVQPRIPFINGTIPHDAEQYAGVTYLGMEEAVLRYITAKGVYWVWRNGSRLQEFDKELAELLERTRHHLGLGV